MLLMLDWTAFFVVAVFFNFSATTTATNQIFSDKTTKNEKISTRNLYIFINSRGKLNEIYFFVIVI